MFTSHIPGQLLEYAFRRVGVQVPFHIHYPFESHPGPEIILLQPGGIEALDRMGINTSDLSDGLFYVQTIRFLDKTGKTIVTYDLGIVTQERARWVWSSKLRELLSSEPVECKNTATTEGEWEREDSPDVYMQEYNGDLKESYRHDILSFDMPNAVIGVYQSRPSFFTFIVIPRTKDVDMKLLLENRPSVINEYIEEERGKRIGRSFSFPNIKLRKQMFTDKELFWGGEALLLHPLSGQNVSFWAREAVHLARLTKKGVPLRVVFGKIEKRARNTFRDHVRTLKFYMRPNIAWKALAPIYSILLRHSVSLRRRVIKNLILTEE